MKMPAPDSHVLVRRARPSDVPAVLLLIKRATDGAVQMSRGELLMALGERSYLIGQDGTEVKMVVGWNTHSTTAVTLDQIFVHPPGAALTVGPAVLAEIEASARELICEVVFAFLPSDVEPSVRQLFEQGGYERMERDELRRAWLPVVDEMQPENTKIIGRVLRDVRIR